MKRAVDGTMTLSPKRAMSRRKAGDQDVRDQEVFRATKELAAYFRGRRTEREARAALKTIKAFIRDRERTDPAHRRPLPGSKTSSSTVRAARKAKSPRKAHHPRRRSLQVESLRAGDSPTSTMSTDPVPSPDE